MASDGLLSEASPFSLAVAAGGVLSYLWWKRRPVEAEKPLPFPEVPRVPGVKYFTQADLAQQDGVKGDGHMYVGVSGKVYDVHSSANFKPGEGYGMLWAGKDATISLALGSLKIEDSNRTDWAVLEDPGLAESLESWQKHFNKKYPVQGYILEWLADHPGVEEFQSPPPEFVPPEDCGFGAQKTDAQ